MDLGMRKDALKGLMKALALMPEKKAEVEIEVEDKSGEVEDEMKANSQNLDESMASPEVKDDEAGDPGKSGIGMKVAKEVEAQGPDKSMSGGESSMLHKSKYEDLSLEELQGIKAELKKRGLL